MERTKITPHPFVMEIYHGCGEAWDEMDAITSLEGAMAILKASGVRCKISKIDLPDEDYIDVIDCEGSEKQVATKIINTYLETSKKIYGEHINDVCVATMSVAFNEKVFERNKDGSINLREPIVRDRTIRE